MKIKVIKKGRNLWKNANLEFELEAETIEDMEKLIKIVHDNFSLALSV